MSSSFTDTQNGKTKKNVSLEIPHMPIILKEGETEPTEMFKRIQQTAYPPIFAKRSWTKGVLYKDVEMFYKPSESIGNCIFLSSDSNVYFETNQLFDFRCNIHPWSSKFENRKFVETEKGPKAQYLGQRW